MEDRYEEMEEVSVQETSVAPEGIEETPAEGDSTAGTSETANYATSGMGKPNDIYDKLGATADRSVHNDPDAEAAIIQSVEPQLQELEKGLAFDQHESDDFTANIKVGLPNGGLQIDDQQETSSYRELVERDSRIKRTEYTDLGKGDSTTEAFAKMMDQETEGKGLLADGTNKNETAVITDSERKPDMSELYHSEKINYTVEDRPSGDMEQAGDTSNAKFNDTDIMKPKDGGSTGETMEDQADLMPAPSEEVDEPEVQDNPGTTPDEEEANDEDFDSEEVPEDEDDEEMPGEESEEDETEDHEEFTSEEDEVEVSDEEVSPEEESTDAVDEMDNEEGQADPAVGGSDTQLTAEVKPETDTREEEDRQETVTAELGGAADIFENSDQGRSLNEPDKDPNKEIVPPNESKSSEEIEEVNAPENTGEIADGQTLGEMLNPEERVNPEERTEDETHMDDEGDIVENHEVDSEADPEIQEEHDPAEDEAPEEDAEFEGGESDDEETEGEESYNNFDSSCNVDSGVEAHLLNLLNEF